MPAQLKSFIIEGAWIDSLDAFYEEIEKKLINGRKWGRNLDALNDILRGGFGTPDEGFRLIWRDHEESRKAMGETDFNTLIEIFRTHGPDGEEREDNIHLILE
ncbi:ribonuclease inhibitor [Parvularcula flava]|uniref:Ribonuclease inhibitor n=1 Tax=Aquisalinus luteolus TaxID=1566827 RepID=A0A8J3A3G6_9PROT|nr:barstar family protein [Aquisalinus luteolus]NHK27656.1 ribonuclease inhibitor [Aquisalinus luteolus]GGH96101.1 ribonuclease inhibitor [Aquisalinus luteolus]